MLKKFHSSIWRRRQFNLYKSACGKGALALMENGYLKAAADKVEAIG